MGFSRGSFRSLGGAGESVLGGEVASLAANGSTRNVLDDGTGSSVVTGVLYAAALQATGRTPLLSANPPVSGTAYQNTAGVAIHLKIPVTATAIGGSAQLALGSGPAPPDFGGAEQIGTIGEVHNVDLTVPAGWYWSVVVVSATIGTASVLGL